MPWFFSSVVLLFERERIYVILCLKIRQRKISAGQTEDGRSHDPQTSAQRNWGNEVSLGVLLIKCSTYSSTELDHVTIMFVFNL